jgi:hypothetical protein
MEFIGDLERAFASAIYPNRFAIAAVGLGVLAIVAFVARRRRWDLAARRRPRTSIAIAVTALVVGLPLAWYLGSPLFTSTTVNEPAPVIGAAPTPSAGPSSTPEPVASAAPTPAPTPAPSLGTVLSGTFEGADDFHFGRGQALLVAVAPDRFVVRLEDFAVRNGPDLFVYLSPSSDGYTDDAVELARLKADRGNQNYDVPAGFDPANAGSVVIWCRQFSVLFAVASLTGRSS